MAVEFSKECDKDQGFDFKQDEHKTFGYINTLRSMSQGRAQYSMQFDHYEQVPQAIADEVKAKYA